MKETFSDWAKAKEFADEIVELGDFEKIKDYLRSRKEFNEKFILSHLDEDTYIYFTDDPYDAFVHDTMTKEYLGFEAIVDAENKKREAIAAYARFLNKSVDEVNKSIEKHRISNNALLCESLFSEGPLDDCNCDIEKLAMDAFNSSLSTEEYIINLLNDEKSIFQVEYYGQSYCNIKELLSEKSNR